MPLLDALRLPFMQRAAVALTLMGLTLPAVGLFILALELVAARFAVMHAALLGAAVALWLGADVTVAATVAALAAGLAVAALSERGDTSASGSLGLVMALSLALAFILFYKGNIHAIEAFNLFWGSVLALTGRDLLVIAALSLALATFAGVLYKEVQVVLYDRELALAVGVPARAIYYGLVVLVCLSVAVAMQVTGALLVDAVTILPALAARQLGRNLRGTLAWGAAFGVATNLLGLALAYALDLPVSPAMIVVGAAWVGVARLWAAREALPR